MAGTAAVDDPVAVLPVLFHLLWRRALVTDLSVPLHPDATVTNYGRGVMGEWARAVLRPGDWVSFGGGEHLVLAVAGTSVRLRERAGAEQVVLAAYLMAAPDFAVVDGAPAPQVEPFGLLDGLPEEARDWERHVVEVETGLSPGAELGTAAPRTPSRAAPLPYAHRPAAAAVSAGRPR